MPFKFHPNAKGRPVLGKAVYLMVPLPMVALIFRCSLIVEENNTLSHLLRIASRVAP
jgi:hypothetical protein